MARELIDSIYVSAFYKVNGKTTQDVTINYKFVGNLERTLGAKSGKSDFAPDKTKDVA